MENLPMIKKVLRLLLVVLFLLLPCLSFAEEPRPTTTDPAPPSSPPTLGGEREGAWRGGVQGGRDHCQVQGGHFAS